MAQASAETIIGKVSGCVTNIEESGDGQVPDSVTVGETVVLAFSYEGDTPLASGNSVFAEYGVDVDLVLTAHIDGLVWEVITPGRWDLNGPIAVQNNAASGDLLSMTSSTVLGGHIGSAFPTNMGGVCEVAFTLCDEEAPFDLTSSLALPTSLGDLDLNAVMRTWGWIAADSPGSDHAVIYFELDPTTLYLRTVPEPSSLVMAMLGLIGMGFAWRRRQGKRSRQA